MKRSLPLMIALILMGFSLSNCSTLDDDSNDSVDSNVSATGQSLVPNDFSKGIQEEVKLPVP